MSILASLSEWFADDFTVVSSSFAKHNSVLLDFDKTASDLDLSPRQMYFWNNYLMAKERIGNEESTLLMAQLATSLKLC